MSQAPDGEYDITAKTFWGDQVELLEILYIILMLAAGSYVLRSVTEVVFMIKDYQKEQEFENGQKEHQALVIGGVD